MGTDNGLAFKFKLFLTFKFSAFFLTSGVECNCYIPTTVGGYNTETAHKQARLSDNWDSESHIGTQSPNCAGPAEQALSSDGT